MLVFIKKLEVIHKQVGAGVSIENSNFENNKARFEGFEFFYKLGDFPRSGIRNKQVSDIEFS